jgi:arabinose-5-phosphate isomerase
MSEIQKVAKKVLKDESEGIELLKDFFDDNFSSAVKKIIEIKGKVIVTGVGKSGHIGKKNFCNIVFYRNTIIFCSSN